MATDIWVSGCKKVMAYFYGFYCIFHLKETTLWWKGVDTSKKNIYINSIYRLLPLCIYELANGKISDSQEADQYLKSQRLRLIYL